MNESLVEIKCFFKFNGVIVVIVIEVSISCSFFFLYSYFLFMREMFSIFIMFELFFLFWNVCIFER